MTVMTIIGYALLATAAAVVVYAFLGYPLSLGILGGRRSAGGAPGDVEPLPVPGNGESAGDPARADRHDGAAWEDGLPTVSITVPAYNEEAQIRETLETLLEVDYPRDRLQILVVSDGSTDDTDRIVEGFADRGVELFRVEGRGGKSRAENVARNRLTGEIVVNTDASVRIRPDAVRKLVARFRDPEVGVASGRDVSVEKGSAQRNQGEAGYVGYEMWVRDLETRTGGIVGASGCLYAIRRHLHDVEVPEHLSRDFMSALTARERGYRAVSVPDALCTVPRTSSLRGEFRRKVRTIVRGMQTLMYKGHLLDPREDGRFAWKLWSHKVARWLFPWAGLASVVGLALVAPTHGWALLALAAAGMLGLLALAGWLWPARKSVPSLVSLPTYLVTGSIATCVATIRALRGYDASVWEPTRREPVDAAMAGS